MCRNPDQGQKIPGAAPYTGSVNRNVLAILITIGLIATAALAFSVYRLQTPEPALAGTGLDNPIPVHQLELLAAGNVPVTLADYTADVTAVFFGFTRCPDVCPLTMAQLADTYRNLGEPDNLKTIMVTVDPGNDTSDITQAYASNFHPAFTGLSGSNQQVAKAASTFFVGYNDTQQGVTHTDALLLVDAQGNFRRVYTADNMPHLEQDLRQILAGADW